MKDVNDRIDETKPHWMKDHELEDARNFKEIKEALARIEGKIDPIVEVYHTASTLGKWTKIFLGFILLCLSIWVAIKNL